MGKIRGRDLGLYVARTTAPSTLNNAGDYTLVGAVTNRNVNRSRNAIDVSSADSGDDSEYLGGRRSREITLDGFYKGEHDAGYAILKAAYDSDGTDLIYWLLTTGVTDDKAEYGRALVTALNTTGEDDGGAQFSVTLQVSGKPTDFTES